MWRYILAILISSFAGSLLNAQEIIPQPNFVEKRSGSFSLEKKVKIQYPAQLDNEAARLKDYLLSDFGITATKAGKGAIKLLIKKGNDNPEGYELTAEKSGVTITGNSSAGVFYGIQTLRQLIKPENGAPAVEYIRITDAPRFKIRSYMLDEARYFKGKTVVRSLLDELARLKINTFHWHLTDDQGWRIEIKKYPLLTSIGGKRAATQIGGWESKKTDNIPHEGFYTQEELKELIAYAEKLHINIIPEIEMPGHSSAAVASYSWLGAAKQPIPVTGMFGVNYNIFDVSDPKVKSFLRDVLTEVMQIFPSKIIHIGGDEVKYKQWAESPTVQAYMKANNLGSPTDLQVAFTNEMSDFIASKGRRMMGWNDIMGVKLHEYNTDIPAATGKLSPQTIVQFWKGDAKLINNALEKGYDIINSYHIYTYLDYDYSEIPLIKAYNFEPIPADIDPKYNKQVLGLGAQMWGEWIPTVKDLERQTFPRIAAYAEVGWTNKDKKDFESFSRRLNIFKKKWEQKGINVGTVAQP